MSAESEVIKALGEVVKVQGEQLKDLREWIELQKDQIGHLNSRMSALEIAYGGPCE